MDLDLDWEQGQFLAQTVALIMYAVCTNCRGSPQKLNSSWARCVSYSVGLEGKAMYPEFQASLSMLMFCLQYFMCWEKVSVARLFHCSLSSATRNNL